jgi:hypothetical protein
LSFSIGSLLQRQESFSGAKENIPQKLLQEVCKEYARVSFFPLTTCGAVKRAVYGEIAASIGSAAACRKRAA